MKLKFWEKEKNTDFFNCHHPHFKNQVEEAFKSGGTVYYRFKKEIAMPVSRYQQLQTFLLEQSIRMDHETFKAFIKEIKSFLDGSKGQINIGKTFELITKMEARAELAFSPDQAYNIASIIFFDETEDIFFYDYTHNKQKIARWKEANELAFFYTMPMSDLCGLSAFSQEDLQVYIRQSEEILNGLISDTQSA